MPAAAAVPAVIMPVLPAPVAPAAAKPPVDAKPPAPVAPAAAKPPIAKPPAPPAPAPTPAPTPAPELASAGRLFGHTQHEDGWQYIHVRGTPQQRGFTYGYLCAEAFARIQAMLEFKMMESYGQAWSDVVRWAVRDFMPIARREYAEQVDEMRAIADGMNAHGAVTTSLDEIFAWNMYCSIPYWLPRVIDGDTGELAIATRGAAASMEGGGGGIAARRVAPPEDRCSAFIAIGSDWTTDGDLVCAHNSFSEYIDGQFSNVVLDLQPEKGFRMLMQTCAGWIWSGTDFFVTSAGILGTETTFGGFIAFEPRAPVGLRIRQAMQYADTMDKYCDELLRNNSGDYANAWLFGDVRAREILRLELGLKHHRIDRTQNGYFIGFNAPYDDKIRNLETVNSGFYDIRRHQGARYVRLSDLMQEHKGKLNLAVAKRLIADHHDVYLDQKNHPCSRTVCSHYDLDAREYMSQSDRPVPFAPRGTVDGMVADGECVRTMSFWGRFGASCDTAFDAAAYFKKHRQFRRFQPFIMDRPKQPWHRWETFEPKSQWSLPTTQEFTQLVESAVRPSSSAVAMNATLAPLALTMDLQDKARAAMAPAAKMRGGRRPSTPKHRPASATRAPRRSTRRRWQLRGHRGHNGASRRGGRVCTPRHHGERISRGRK